MKLFGLEIRRVPKPAPPLSPAEAFALAVDEINLAWNNAAAQGHNLRPWIDWEARELILTVAGRGSQEVYNSTDGWL